MGTAHVLSLSKKPRRVSRPVGAKGTVIIFGGGVYVAENKMCIRDRVSNYMRAMIQAEPTDESLIEFEDDITW